jgi:hypothetical protein
MNFDPDHAGQCKLDSKTIHPRRVVVVSSRGSGGSMETVQLLNRRFFFGGLIERLRWFILDVVAELAKFIWCGGSLEG